MGGREDSTIMMESEQDTELGTRMQFIQIHKKALPVKSSVPWASRLAPMPQNLKRRHP